MPTTKIAEVGEEPVSLEEARRHLRVDPGDEDPLIAALITAARQMCEGELGRAIVTSNFELRTDAFAPALRLERPRVLDVDAVEYLDADGELQTLDPADYVLDASCDVAAAWLAPARGKAWPDTSCEIGAVRVRYTSGFGDTPAAVPQAIRTWILLHVAAMYEHREAVAAKDMKSLPFLAGLIDQYRVW